MVMVVLGPHEDIADRIRSAIPRFPCRGAPGLGQTPGAPLLGVWLEASGGASVNVWCVPGVQSVRVFKRKLTGRCWVCQVSG